MAIEAALAEELAGFQDGNDRFPAFLRYDSELDPATLNVENRVGDVSLRKDVLALVKCQYGLSRSNSGEKVKWIKRFTELHAHGALCLIRAQPIDSRINYSDFHIG